MVSEKEKIALIRNTIKALAAKGYVYYPVDKTTDAQLLETWGQNNYSAKELERFIENNAIADPDEFF